MAYKNPETAKWCRADYQRRRYYADPAYRQKRNESAHRYRATLKADPVLWAEYLAKRAAAKRQERKDRKHDPVWQELLRQSKARYRAAHPEYAENQRKAVRKHTAKVKAQEAKARESRLQKAKELNEQAKARVAAAGFGYNVNTK
jgi:hypothetical protein